MSKWVQDDFLHGEETTLSLGEVRGYRHWIVRPSIREQVEYQMAGVDLDDIQVQLLPTAVARSAVWQPGENSAICQTHGYYAHGVTAGKHKQIAAPHPACTCGFYALYKPQSLWDPGVWAGSLIYGAVAGYGMTILGRKGFRAGKARIEALVGNVNRNPFLREWGIPIFRTRWQLHRKFPPSDLSAFGVNPQ